MSITSDPDAGRAVINNMNLDESGVGTRHMRLTERQKELNELYAYYKVAEHDAKGVDWQGKPVMRRAARDAISRQGYIPPGFYDAGGDTLPMDFRRPAAPLGIVRTIVARFTGLLFSERRHPRVTVPGDPNTEDYINALMEQGMFWGTMALCRNYGGAMGSACIGFRVNEGNVSFEALDPRWCTPEFIGRSYTDLEKITIQYTYSKEERDEVTGGWTQKWYWFRRVVDRMTDTVWVPIRCKDHDKEPPWDYMRKNTIAHNYGFVPYEWIQNIKSDDELDGDPDAVGCYDLVRTVDQLLSEVWSGTISNCDPTLTLITDMDLNAIKKGSDNAIRMNQGSSAQYLELGGNGPRTGLEVAKALEDRIFRLAQCVPDNVLFETGGEKTATEIERVFSSMLEKADQLRSQYGPAIVRICQKLISAVRMLVAVRQLEDGRFVRYRINVSPRVVQQGDGDSVEIPRDIGRGTLVRVIWPPYYSPSLNDVDTAIRLATTAKDSEVLTKTSAVNYFAPLMGVDPLKELLALKKEAEANAPPPEEEGAEEGAPEEAEADAVAWKEALQQGLCTINEYREKVLLLGALPDGDYTLPEYKAMHAELFTAAAAVASQAAINNAVTPPMPQDSAQGQAPGKPGAAPPQGAKAGPGRPKTGQKQTSSEAPRAQKKSARKPQQSASAEVPAETKESGT